MNRTIGLTGSLLVTVATVGFALSMLLASLPAAWATSMAIAFGYVLLASALSAEASESRKGAAYAAISFGTLYAILVIPVYFVQLTTVTYRTASTDILAVLSYANHGSLMFNLDLLGYGMMALSTFFVGLTIVPINGRHRALKVLLMLHGLFAPGCVLLPMFNVFGAATGAGGDLAGTIALLGWCLYFTPLGLLAVAHFLVSEPRASLPIDSARGQRKDGVQPHRNDHVSALVAHSGGKD